MNTRDITAPLGVAKYIVDAYRRNSFGAKVRNASEEDFNFKPINSKRGTFTPIYPTTVDPYGEAAIQNSLVFQFNPFPIDDDEITEYHTREYLGKRKVDRIWIRGKGRRMSFKLDLDASVGSETKTFRVEGDKHNPEVGIMEQVRKLKQFLLPAEFDNPYKPTFILANGNTAPTAQFIAPPRMVFTYGKWYLEAKMESCPIKYTLFNSNLVPIRGEAQVSLLIEDGFEVKESAFIRNISTNISLIS